MLSPRVRLPHLRTRVPALLRWLHTLWTGPTNLVGHLAGWLVSGHHARRVEGPAARAWLYDIRPGIGLGWIGAVTLGHVVLFRRNMFDGRLGRMVLAHELAHTRQHDWLGPLYLPLHILAQSTSALISISSRRSPHHSRVHDHNPLEQTFICLGAAAYAPLARGERIAGADPSCDGDAMLKAFGLDGPDP